MKFSAKRVFPACVLFAATVAIAVISFQVRAYASATHQSLPYFLWTIVWTFLVAAVFSWNHIKKWFLKTDLRINFPYLFFVAAILLLDMVPVSPLFLFFTVYDSTGLFFLLVWYGVIHVFEKDPEKGSVTSLPVPADNEKESAA